MKTYSNITIAFTTFILSITSVAKAAVLLIEDFEDNTVFYTASDGEFHDGSSDYFTIVPLNSPANPVSAYTGFGGSNYFAAEDIDDGATRPSSQTLAFTVNILGYENITFGTLFAAGGNGVAVPSYDSNDGFLIRASIDSGAFQNLLAFEAIGATNQQLAQDTDFDGTGDGLVPTSAFTGFNGLSILGTGSSLTLEVIVDSNDGNAEFAFDDIIIEGDLVPEPSSALLALIGGAWLFGRRRK